MSSAFVRKAGKLRFMLAAAALITVVLAGTTGAQQNQGPCADDLPRFCKDVQPGGGRIAQCMWKHEQDLSPGCKQHMAQLKKWVNEFRAACEDDVVKLCGNAKQGEGRIINCLKKHEQKLTPDCRKAMDEK